MGVQAFFIIGGLKSMGIFFVEILGEFQSDSRLTALTLGLTAFGFAIAGSVACWV